jgi:hypothetical protein
MIAAAFGSNPLPIIFTEVPTGPEVWLSVMVGIVEGVTVNVFDAKFAPWVAVTVSDPLNDEGTLKVPLKVPVEVVFNGEGFVVTPFKPNSMVTSELGANPLPTILTEVPTGPVFGLMVMAGTVEEVTVNVLEAELDPVVVASTV